MQVLACQLAEEYLLKFSSHGQKRTSKSIEQNCVLEAWTSCLLTWSAINTQTCFTAALFMTVIKSNCHQLFMHLKYIWAVKENYNSPSCLLIVRKLKKITCNLDRVWNYCTLHLNGLAFSKWKSKGSVNKIGTGFSKKKVWKLSLSWENQQTWVFVNTSVLFDDLTPMLRPLPSLSSFRAGEEKALSDFASTHSYVLVFSLFDHACLKSLFFSCFIITWSTLW